MATVTACNTMYCYIYISKLSLCPLSKAAHETLWSKDIAVVFWGVFNDIRLIFHGTLGPIGLAPSHDSFIRIRKYLPAII